MSPIALKRLSDERLSGRLAAGEAAAFDELYQRYSHRLSAYGAYLLGDAAAGEDVAQAALLKAYQALRSGRLPERVRPWLYRIAHNTAIDSLGRRRELPTAEAIEGAAGDPHEGSAVRGQLIAALAGLPERQRRAYALREIHGLRVAEIAGELGLTAAQVEQALFAARNRLAELIVFGERLSCDVVRRLAEGSLDRTERKALKSHLRACPSCRSSVGRRTAALGLFPLPAIDWLRGAAAGLLGGGGASAAKVGSVVASATLAAGVPLAVHEETISNPRPAATAGASLSAGAERPSDVRSGSNGSGHDADLERSGRSGHGGSGPSERAGREHDDGDGGEGDGAEPEHPTGSAGHDGSGDSGSRHGDAAPKPEGGESGSGHTSGDAPGEPRSPEGSGSGSGSGEGSGSGGGPDFGEGSDSKDGSGGGSGDGGSGSGSDDSFAPS